MGRIFLKKSECPGIKGITLAHNASVVAQFKPAPSLGRRPVRE
jgi:hypothetical protein